LRLSSYISRDTLTNALNNEIQKRTASKKRETKAVQSTQNKVQEMALKKLSEDARRAQDRELIRQQARKARDAIDIKLKKLKDTKEYQLKNENEQKKITER